MADDGDTDSDATTCDPTCLDDSFGDVHVIPDSQYNGSAVNCSSHRSTPTKSITPRSQFGGARDGSHATYLHMISPVKKETHLVLDPSVTTEASPLRAESPTGEEESPSGFGEVENQTALHKDMGFDDQYFIRPRFHHSPTNKKKPYTLSPPEVYPPLQIPAVLNQYLRDYQQLGVQFLYDHYSRNTGALLCDDMGLGKTIQVIAFVCAVLRKTCTKTDVILTSPRETCSKGCFLVVCPSSVLYNWTSEIETWSHLKYGVYHREKKSDTLDKAKRNKLDVVMTTHDTARTHVDELNMVDWQAVISDEVQTIKNPQSQVTAAMNSLRVRRRFGLTGTALQNNLTELWCLLNWANPGCLGSLSSFHGNYEKPILEGQKFDCTKRQLAFGRQRQAELEDLMKQWILRRTKAVIALQLPKKEEFVVFCPITELQENIYQTLIECEDVQIILHNSEPCDCHSGEKRGQCCHQVNSEGVHWSKLVYEYLPLFTKCANHLGLLLPERTHSHRQKEKATQMCSVAFSKHPQFLELSRKASFVTLTDPKYCGKMQVLQKLLAKFKREKDKVIIFSYSTNLLDILEDYLISWGYVYSRLDGSTKIEERSHLVHSFNTDPTQFVFLISKKCGGVGLNVTGANRVIIFDPSWNPATDVQAEDRAFRIGQSRDVRVYRFITEGTVEEMIYLRQVYKQQLANTTMEGSKERRYFTAVAGDRHQQGELFGYANLIPLRKPGSDSNLTLDLLKRADRVEAGVKIMTDCSQLEQNVAKEVHVDSQGCLLPGATTILHTGKKSVIGNSKVEEHISKQAHTDVYELEQCSQEPANFVKDKLEDGFSDESDDIDFKMSPPRKKKGKISPDPLPAQTQADSSRLDVEEEPGIKALRHEHFEKMAQKFGYSSSYEFALFVQDATKDERQQLVDEFYGTEGRGKGKRKLVCPKEPAKGTKRTVSTTRGRRRSAKPPLQFEDSPPEKRTCNSTLEGHPFVETVGLTCQTLPTVDETCLENPVTEPCESEDIFKTPSLEHNMGVSSSHLDPPQPTVAIASSIDELFGNTCIRVEESTCGRTPLNVNSLPSVNIDELFGL